MKYLFKWNNIPGKDNGKLIGFLNTKYHTNFNKKPKIEKADCNTIRISNGTEVKEIKLNKEKTTVTFDGQNILIARPKEDGEINIFKPLDHTIRTINLKLLPDDEQGELLNNCIEQCRCIHDIAVNKYLDMGRDLDKNEKIALRSEIENIEFGGQYGNVIGKSGTIRDNIIGQGGAKKYVSTIKEKIYTDLKRREETIKKLSEIHPNITAVKGIWFQKIKPKKGQCAMCNKNETMHRESNETNELLCLPCFGYYRTYGATIKGLKRRSFEFYALYEDYLKNNVVSDKLKTIIHNAGEYRKKLNKKKGLENTINNKILLKNQGTIIKKIDLKNNILHLSIRKKAIDQIKFTGEHYFNNFPSYGKNVNKNKFKILIDKFLNSGTASGGATIYKKDNEFFLSIPCHYPLYKPPLIIGCIIVSNRFVLIYSKNHVPIFIKLHRHYMKKIIIKKKNKIIQKTNDSLKEEKKPLLPYINISKYIRFQNHIVSRIVVEEAKKLNGSFLLLDYTHLNTAKETLIPITELNSKIKDKLCYDSIYAGEIHYSKIKSLKCPSHACDFIMPERYDDDNNKNRLVIRDIIVNKTKEWQCEKCEYEINPMLLIANNLLKLGEDNVKNEVF